VFQEGETSSVTAEDTFWTKDGKAFPAKYVITPLMEDGRKVGAVMLFRDITDRKEAEETIKSLVLNSPMGIFIAQGGKFKMVNTAFKEDVGHTGEELLGEDAFSLITPEFKERVRDNVIQMLKGERSAPFEFQIVNRRGEPKWLLEKVTPINYKGEKAVLGYFMDITERKQAEKALEKVQSQQRAMLDNIPDIAWLKDQESRYIAANEPFAQAIGFSREDLVGRTDLEFWPQELAEKYRQDDQEVMRDGRRKMWEEPLVDKDAKMVWIETIKTPIFNDQGEVIGTTGIARDITARKQIEDDLRRAHREIEQLFDSIPSIVISLSMTGIVHAWNAAAERLLGLTALAVLGQELQKFPINWEWDRIAEGLARCEETSKMVRVESVRFKRPDGKEGFLGISINPVKAEEGWLSGLILLGADITERKILEGQLAQAQKLESIGQLAAGIAHEINTPIQYVGDNTRFLQESFRELFQLIEDYRGLLAGEATGEGNGDLQQRVEDLLAQADIDYLEEEIPKAIQQTLEGVERVAKIVRAMKDFSHPGRAEKTLTDLNKALDNTITVARNEWKYVAEIVTDLDSSLPLVPLLPNEFNQVILNIIINAAHAIADVVDKGRGEKGAITISTRRLGDEVEVRLQDTGSGIPQEIQERIFDPFFTTKEVGKGTGQGLAISHDVIVEKHGGAITFETEVGQGTTFIIRLPLGQQPEIKEKPDEDSHSLCR
jgi:PAS domain S-box-containing protein